MSATRTQPKKGITFSPRNGGVKRPRNGAGTRRRRMSGREARACELAGTLTPSEGVKDRIHLQKYELSSGTRRWGAGHGGGVLVCRRSASFGKHVSGSRERVASLQREVLRGADGTLTECPSMPESVLFLLGRMFGEIYRRNLASGSSSVDLSMTVSNVELMAILGCGRDMLDTFKTYAVSAGLVTVMNPVSRGGTWGCNTYTLNLSPTAETVEYLAEEMHWSRDLVEEFRESMERSHRMVAAGADPRFLVDDGVPRTSWADCARVMAAMRADVCGDPGVTDVGMLADELERRGAEEGMGPEQVARAYLYNIATNHSLKRLIKPGTFVSGTQRDGSVYRHDPLRLASRNAERYAHPVLDGVLAAYLAAGGGTPDLPDGWFDELRAEGRVCLCGRQTAIGAAPGPDRARGGTLASEERLPSLRERVDAVLLAVADDPRRPVEPGEFLDPADPSPITRYECMLVAWLCHGYPASVGTEFFTYACSRGWGNAGGGKVTRANLSDKVRSYARHGDHGAPSAATAAVRLLVWPEARDWDRAACPAAGTAAEANVLALERAMGLAAKRGVRPVLEAVDWPEVHGRRNGVGSYTPDDAAAHALRGMA